MQLKLYMVLLGCTPKGRHTEQHDIFFGIGNSIASLKDEMDAFWQNSGGLHIDAWREVTNVNGHSITVTSKKAEVLKSQQLFFLNLGGYKQNEFEEFHYKMLVAAATKGDAVKAGMQTAFYKHANLPGPGASHIDDRYGVDVDDIFKIEDILPAAVKQQYSLQVSEQPVAGLPEDELHLGYLKWSTLEKQLRETA
ncbi:MAG: DUF1543 domain-containing protein [Ferruginibacter sp.]